MTILCAINDWLFAQLHLISPEEESFYWNTLFDGDKNGFNPCLDDKILDKSKLKGFADDKINATQKLKLVLGRLENIVGKGENAGLPAFSPFPTTFSKGFLYRVLKSVKQLPDNKILDWSKLKQVAG